MAKINNQGKSPFDILQEQKNNFNADVEKQKQDRLNAVKRIRRQRKLSLLFHFFDDVSHVLFLTALISTVFFKFFLAGFWPANFSGTFLNTVFPFLLLGIFFIPTLSLGIACFVVKKKYKTSNTFVFWFYYVVLLIFCVFVIPPLGYTYAYLVTLGVLAVFCVMLIPLRRWNRPSTKHKKVCRAFTCIMPFVGFLLMFCAYLPTTSTLFSDKDHFSVSDLGQRNVCYDRNYHYYGGMVTELDYVMLTAGDYLKIPYKQDFVVHDKVTIRKTEYEVTAINSNAFSGVRSFSGVVLPSTVMYIYDGAFAGSDISRLTVQSTALYIEDGFVGSSIREIYLPNSELTKFTLDKGATLKDDLLFRVQAEKIDEFRQAHPDFADRFVPIVEDNQLYVNFNISAPKDSGLDEYIPTVIAEKDENGQITAELPYSDKTDVSDLHGTHFVHKQGNKTYRLFAFTANGEKIDAESGFVSTDTSLDIYGEWQEMHTLYADYSSGGGELVALGEIHEELEAYVLPTGITLSTNEGYVCNQWYASPELDGESITFVKNPNADVTVYPKWSLIEPTIDAVRVSYQSAFGIPATDTIERADEGFGVIALDYSGQEYIIAVSVSHPISPNCSYSFSWTKDEEIVCTTESLTVKDIADSGSYTVKITVWDENDNFAVTLQMFDIVISPTETQL